jgi:CRISPR/Cas system-associated exonuclease Cas4 (RecB family)
MESYSKSKIDTFKKCKKQFKLKYIDKIYLPQPHSDDLQFGHWIHKVLEDYSPDKGNLKDVAMLQREFDIRGKDYINAMPETFKNAIAFTKKYWKYPRQTEEKVNYEDEDMALGGVIDLRLEHKDDTLMVVDYKSSRSPNAARHEYQMKMYTYILWKMMDIKPEKIRVMIYYPRIDAYDRYQFSSGEIKLFGEELMRDIAMIETADKYPAEPGYHCRWCQYLNTEHCSKGQKP